MLKTELIQLSCVLSMLGSCLVVFTWAYPAENRSKPGRVLLLWVSVADFFSSLFYFIQTFPAVTEQAQICQALALLDIFFPVASFLWTDFVAFYLYLVVHYRSVDFVLAWGKLLRAFHLVAWSLSLLVVLLVLLTHHAGNNAYDDDANADNTAGWCWISAKDKEQRFLWELVGGKCVEWVSGLVVVPFFYVSVARKLYHIDHGAWPVSDRAVVQNVPSFVGAQRASGGAIADNKSEQGLTLTLPRTTSTIPSDTVYPPLTVMSTCSERQNNSSANSSMQSSVRMAYEDSDREQTSSFSTVSIEGRLRNDNSYNEDDDGDNERSQRHSVQYFNRFYLKLFLLPLVFIFIRFWSSLRIVLAFAGRDKMANNGFLVVMQAFFDPSQGFFNSLLFVFFSKTDRNRLLRSLRRCLPWTSNIQEENPSRANKRSKAAASSITQMQNNNRRDSDESEIEIEDLENDFECDVKDRLSDFSFDSRLDTTAVNPMSQSISFKL